MHKLYFLIGSSGSGKSTAAESIKSMNIPGLTTLDSDSVKIPSVAEMIEMYGSTEAWQRENTIKWTKDIKEKYLETSNVLFDVQSRPSFIDEACSLSGIDSYQIILIDCADDERKRRLIEERGQPELANDQMMDWARYLRENCHGTNCQIIDTTYIEKEESLKKLLSIITK